MKGVKGIARIKGITMLLVLGLALGGCGVGKTSESVKENGNTGGKNGEAQVGNTVTEQNAGLYDQTTGEVKWTEMTDTFPSMLWGRYTYDERTSSEASDATLDYKKFYESVKFIKCSVTLDGKSVSKELSAPPH